MTLSLYDISVPGFKQVMGTANGLLDKGAAYCQENNLSLDSMLNSSLHEEMRPFRAQIVYTVTFPKMALASLKSGEFSHANRNNLPDDLTHADLKQMVADFAAELDTVRADDINALAGNTVMINKLPDVHTPFTATNFILSFLHPNIYFHVSTAYDIIRMLGVPVEKKDIIGPFRSKM